MCVQLISESIRVIVRSLGAEIHMVSLEKEKVFLTTELSFFCPDGWYLFHNYNLSINKLYAPYIILNLHNLTHQQISRKK